MLAKASCAIDETTTAATLHDALAALGAPLLLEVLDDPKSYLARGEVQSDKDATYADKIDKREAQIDWALDAAVITQQVRAFNPFPVCFSELDGERIKIWQANTCARTVTAGPGTLIASGPAGIVVACGEGALNITQLQIPGGKALTAEQVLNARSDKFAVGRAFTSPSEAN
jgi:methionyl-tRNA formyltransferase